MLRHGIFIGRIFEVAIDLDYSWFLMVALLAWMLATSYYPVKYHGWTLSEYWLLGTLTSLLLFASVLVHELGHSVVAIRHGLKVPRITLFIFGGVSQIATEPADARSEFRIAIVGPLISLIIAALCWFGLPPMVAAWPAAVAMLRILGVMNLALAVFNLIPGFPLDGGRVLRALVWRWSGNFHRATEIAAMSGRFFGFALIFSGAWQLLAGQSVNGLWTAFIGWFLESAAGRQLQQESAKSLLAAHRVLEAMNRDVPWVPAGITLEELVDHYVLHGRAHYFIVGTPAGEAAGVVTLATIGNTPRREWATATASSVAVPMNRLPTVRPETPLWTAMEQMGRDGVKQMPVMDENGLVAMISQEDVVHYLRGLKAVA